MALSSRLLLLSRKPVSRAGNIRRVPVVQCRWMATEDETKPTEKVKKTSKETVSVADLADVIAGEHDLTKVASKRILESLFDNISQAISDNKKVSINNFGYFERMHSKSKQGTNPKTQEPLTIPAKERIKFKAFTHFKEMVNKK